MSEAAPVPTPAAIPLPPAAEAPAPLPSKAFLAELGDLKRVRSAGREGSIATRLFARAWGALAHKVAPDEVMVTTLAAALAAARLGDLDAEALRDLGLSKGEARTVLERAYDELAGGIAQPLRGVLREGLGHDEDRSGHAPEFVAALAAQPRAGVTRPGRPRLVLEPPENHAEHCLVVALYGVLMAPHYGADPVTVFLAALAHHLHNAAMPDSGFTGEELLGGHLIPVMERASEAALDELGRKLRGHVERARAILPDAETPEGRAFHAADVADRVLQIASHLAAATATMGFVLDEMELVHAGPVKGFHDAVLVDLGLA